MGGLYGNIPNYSDFASAGCGLQSSLEDIGAVAASFSCCSNWQIDRDITGVQRYSSFNLSHAPVSNSAFHPSEVGK